jgi:outer membrane protein
MRTAISIFYSMLLALPVSAADWGKVGLDAINLPKEGLDAVASGAASLERPYSPKHIHPASFTDSGRLQKLLRGGNIYLSLQDAIALALENNLDIQSARYLSKIAESDVLRASAGQLLRNTPTSVTQGPPSASGSLVGATPIGYDSGTQTGVLSGLSIQLAGSQIPNLDPVISSKTEFEHQVLPQMNQVVSGTNSLLSDYRNSQIGYQQGFLSGTVVNVGLTNINLRQNSPNNDFNPATTAGLSIDLTQHLLQGFGWGVNSRAIIIAKNNRRVSDLTFKRQVIATISNVVDMYWDLVAFNDELKVKRQGLAASEKLYQDDKKRLELGVATPVEIMDAEEEVATDQQDITEAETQVLEQELVLKNVLSRAGLSDPLIAEAPIIPTDRLEAPAAEEVSASEPLSNVVERALQQRPEMEESAIELQNRRISLRGTKNALRPSLDLFVHLQNNALAGQQNTIPPMVPPGGFPIARTIDPALLGGYGTVLSQLFGRDFADSAVGFQLNIPLRNRAAQADMIRDELDLRQQEIADQKLRNSIRLDVLKAAIALREARKGYKASLKAKQLKQDAYDSEQKMYAYGTSNAMRLVSIQHDVQVRQLEAVTALNTYARAQNHFDAVMGDTFTKFQLSLDDAYGGDIRSQPSQSAPVAPSRTISDLEPRSTPR